VKRMMPTSDKRRLLDAFAGRAPRGAPFFEEVIEQRPAERVLGRALPGGTREMAPEDYVELALRLGLDAIIAHTAGWLEGGRYREASNGARRYAGGSEIGERDLLRVVGEGAEAAENVRRYAAAVRDSRPAVMAWLPGIITSPAIAMGYEAFALALYDRPELISRACDAQTQRTLQALDAAVDGGADAVALGDDISDSNGPMMAPDMLRGLWLERARTVTARARARGVPAMLHCCGHLAVVLPLAIEAGFDAIQPVAACNDVPGILAAARERIAVLGTIDVGSVLVRGSPAEVRAAALADWEAYGPAGFALGSNHSINDAVPEANLRALAAAVAELRA